MNLSRILIALAREVATEAERNPNFKTRLHAVLGTTEAVIKSKKERTLAKTPLESSSARTALSKRPSNRRKAAVLDPVNLARQSEALLRTELGRLDLEQLRDIVAEYGMDTGKLVTKWRSSDRIIDRIVDVAKGRAQKGNAFRDTGGEDSSTEGETN